MRAYHNNPELKAKFINLLVQHQQQDKIIKGTYWEDGKGCAVGCSINSLNMIVGSRYEHDAHEAYEPLIGVPRHLAHLEDSIFEGLAAQEAQAWPVRFAEAIPVGADLSLVWARFVLWLLVDKHHGVTRFAQPEHQSIIQKVANLYQQQIDGTLLLSDTWNWINVADHIYITAAESYAAESYAAYSASYAARANSITSYIAAAVNYAADTYAANTYQRYISYKGAHESYKEAHEQARQAQADKLIELLRACQ